MKWRIFKLWTTYHCFLFLFPQFFLVTIVMGILTILWFCLTFPPVKWGFSICLVSTESLLSSLLLFLRFETSSHVFRSVAIVFPHASKPLRMSFTVSRLSSLCFFFLRFETSSHVFRSFAIVPKAARFAHCPPAARFAHCPPTTQQFRNAFS